MQIPTSFLGMQVMQSVQKAYPFLPVIERFNKDEIIDFEIISRSNINSKLSGPKIIVESTAITYVDVNYEVSNDSDHNLLIINKEMK